MGKEQRSLGNYVRTAGLSKGYYLHVLLGGIGFWGVILVFATSQIRDVSYLVATIPDVALASLIEERLIVLNISFFVSFLAFVLAAVLYVIIISQRVGGPVVAILAFIDELKKGNYGAKRTLRKNDELTPIMTSLKELAAQLEKSKPS